MRTFPMAVLAIVVGGATGVWIGVSRGDPPDCVVLCNETLYNYLCGTLGNPCVKFEDKTCSYCTGAGDNCLQGRSVSCVASDQPNTRVSYGITCEACPCVDSQGVPYIHAEAWNMGATGAWTNIPRNKCQAAP